MTSSDAKITKEPLKLTDGEEAGPNVDPAQACSAEIAEVLARHGCRLVPYIAQPEYVGQAGRTIQISADVVVVADRAPKK